MSLIMQQNQPSVVEQIKRVNSGCLYQMKQSAKQTYDLLWHNKDKTPQEVCDLLGVDAASGFDIHGALQTLIYQLDNSWVPLVPTHSYVKNVDGTVTIGEEI